MMQVVCCSSKQVSLDKKKCKTDASQFIRIQVNPKGVIPQYKR